MSSSRYSDRAICPLDSLAEETFELWDEEWVGFSWSRYFINHTRRVRSLALDLADKEEANGQVLALAATLHDITKRYDGDIVRDNDGNRIVGEDGLWRNQFLPPSRSNVVTELYRKLNLEGSLHSHSGAIIARNLLQNEGVPQDTIEQVAQCIDDHVRLQNGEYDTTSLEADILFDADTLDANMGLVAFYRNIMIHCHRAKRQHGTADLAEYIRYIPSWLDMKEPFVNRMKTEAGRQRAIVRQKRNIVTCNKLLAELNNPDRSHNAGLLAAVSYLIAQTAYPDIERDRQYLRHQWLQTQPTEPLRAEAKHFCDLLDAEVEGTE